MRDRPCHPVHSIRAARPRRRPHRGARRCLGPGDRQQQRHRRV